MLIGWSCVPIWFQTIKGSLALHAGLQTLPMVFSVEVGIAVRTNESELVGRHLLDYPESYLSVI
jgi:hypothetical protein